VAHEEHALVREDDQGVLRERVKGEARTSPHSIRSFT
jgi:hypothetical protein